MEYGHYFQELYTRLRQNLERPVRGLIDFDKLELSDIIMNGQELEYGKGLWVNLDGQLLLCHYEDSRISEDPRHTFTFTSGNEDVTLKIYSNHFDINHQIMTLIGRNLHREDEVTLDLPQGIGIRIYNKLPRFLNDLASVVGPFTHVIKKGAPQRKSIPYDKWLTKFMPFIEQNGYTAQKMSNELHNVYVKNYPAD